MPSIYYSEGISVSTFDLNRCKKYGAFVTFRWLRFGYSKKKAPRRVAEEYKKSDIIALEIKDVILLSFIFLTKGFLTISIHLSIYLSRESDITLDVGTTFNIFCFSVMLCRDSNPSSTRQRADFTIVADYHSWLEDLLCIVLPLVAEFSRHYHLLDFLPNIVRGEEGERVGYLAGHL